MRSMFVFLLVLYSHVVGMKADVLMSLILLYYYYYYYYCCYLYPRDIFSRGRIGYNHV